jgi:hypothetical protein
MWLCSNEEVNCIFFFRIFLRTLAAGKRFADKVYLKVMEEGCKGKPELSGFPLQTKT